MGRQSGEDLKMTIGLTTRLTRHIGSRCIPARGSAVWAVLLAGVLLLPMLIPGVAVPPLAPNTVFAAGPTTLPLRSGSSVGIFQNTSGRTIQSTYGASLTTE